jgi:hypothetical protein
MLNLKPTPLMPAPPAARSPAAAPLPLRGAWTDASHARRHRYPASPPLALAAKRALLRRAALAREDAAAGDRDAAAAAHLLRHLAAARS